MLSGQKLHKTDWYSTEWYWVQWSVLVSFILLSVIHPNAPDIRTMNNIPQCYLLLKVKIGLNESF